MAPQRLIDGLTRAAGEYGFADLTVERVLAVAQVSRATFYSYFSDVRDCFRLAYRHHADRLVAEVANALAVCRDPEVAALEAINGFVVAQPTVACLLLREGLAAGPVGLIEREALIARLAQSIRAAPAAQAGIDLPLELLIGGAFRFLVMRLADGTSHCVDAELRAWAGAFPAPAVGPAWSNRLAPAWGDVSSPTVLAGHRPKGPVRERILRGTALAIRAKGYQDVSVADIVSAAGVSRRGFYTEFSSKADAYIAAYELVFQRVLAATAPAFFEQRDWRERVWHAAIAFTGTIAREPLLTYLGLVECYAIGPDFTRRVHDTQLAFTLFLEDGYRQRPESESLPRSFSQLVAATIFELAFHASRRGPRFDARRVQPLAVYIALAPFIGAEEAGRFVIQAVSMQHTDDGPPA